MHIGLCGPCSPSGVSDLLHPADAARADEFLGIGGVPVYELARALVGAGHRVTVVTTSGGPDVGGATFRGANLEVVAVPRRAAGAAIRGGYGRERSEMARFLRDAAPDVVHAHWTYEFELAAQDSGLPHVTTAHDAPFTILAQMRDPYRVARLGVALRARPGIRWLSTVSPYLARAWRQQMGYRDPITVIPNSMPVSGVPLQRVPSGHATILEVADAGSRKNVRGLVRAHAWVRQARPDAELRIAGPGLGPDDSLALWALERQMSAGVTFLGVLSRDQLAGEYARAWVFAHASLEEACPMTLLEAHGAALPIVGGRHSGGVPYVLDHGRAGWLTDVRDPRALAGTISTLIAEGPPAQTQFAATYARDTFSSVAVTAAYTDWYESFLHDSGRNR